MNLDPASEVVAVFGIEFESAEIEAPIRIVCVVARQAILFKKSIRTCKRLGRAERCVDKDMSSCVDKKARITTENGF